MLDIYVFSLSVHVRAKDIIGALSWQSTLVKAVKGGAMEPKQSFGHSNGFVER